MKKKLLITLLALTMAVSSAACTSSKNTSKTDKTEKKATESVAESVTETSTESTAVNEAVKGQESSEVSDTAAGVKADDSIAAGAATTDSRQIQIMKAHLPEHQLIRKNPEKKQKIIKNLLHQLQL